MSTTASHITVTQLRHDFNIQTREQLEKHTDYNDVGSAIMFGEKQISEHTLKWFK
jgi:hypothetical protein